MSAHKKNEYSTFRNLRYFYRELFCFNPRVYAAMIVCAIVKTLQVTLANLLPKEVIRLVTMGAEPAHAILWITLLIVLEETLSPGEMFLFYYVNDWGLRFRHHLEQKALVRLTSTDYSNAESPSMRIRYQKAREVFGNWDQDARNAMLDTMSILTSLLGIFFYGAAIAALDPLILVLLLINALAFDCISRYQNRYVAENSEKWESVNVRLNYMEDIGQKFACAKDIRLYGMSGWLGDKYKSLLTERLFWAKKLMGVFFWKGSLWQTSLSLLRNAVVYLVLISMVRKGELKADEFVLYLAMVTSLSSWINSLMNDVRDIRKCAVYLTDYRQLLNIPDSWDYQGGIPFPGGNTSPASIEFERVSFSYGEASEPILRDISFFIHPGEKVALVGQNGAGKTTLVKNLCGLYKPDAGTIRINGIPASEYNHTEYYQFFSAVFQDVNIVPGTILQNVTMQTKEAGDETRARMCLEKAGLWDRVTALPHKMDTFLQKKLYEDAVELSGGEKQKLLLARAIYKEAPILILDEPTAALDPIAEDRLYRSYQELTKQRTAIYISHRLSSTRFCDRIFFLKDGQIVECGSHEELMAKGGEYARLFALQSHYYQNDSHARYHSGLDPDLGVSQYEG